MTLRIHADFNSGGLAGEAPCWALRYGPDKTPLNDVAQELDLHDGQDVVLFYEDPSEEFEVSGKLIEPKGPGHNWAALPNWETLRRIRG